MARHRHADLIHAWAEGSTIQYKNKYVDWRDCDNNFPKWDSTCEYRIKPEKKPDVVCFYTVTEHTRQSGQRLSGDNLCCTFDGETGKLIKAEVL